MSFLKNFTRWVFVFFTKLLLYFFVLIATYFTLSFIERVIENWGGEYTGWFVVYDYQSKSIERLELVGGKTQFKFHGEIELGCVETDGYSICTESAEDNHYLVNLVSLPERDTAFIKEKYEIRAGEFYFRDRYFHGFGHMMIAFPISFLVYVLIQSLVKNRILNRFLDEKMLAETIRSMREKRSDV